MVTLHSGGVSIPRKSNIKLTAISDDGEHEVGQEERFKVSTRGNVKKFRVWGKGNWL